MVWRSSDPPPFRTLLGISLAFRPIPALIRLESKRFRKMVESEGNRWAKPGRLPARASGMLHMFRGSPPGLASQREIPEVVAEAPAAVVALELDRDGPLVAHEGVVDGKQGPGAFEDGRTDLELHHGQEAEQCVGSQHIPQERSRILASDRGRIHRNPEAADKVGEPFGIRVGAGNPPSGRRFPKEGTEQ